jgi:photosystem II stability/assembly factor-like uncharacterized protein
MKIILFWVILPLVFVFTWLLNKNAQRANTYLWHQSLTGGGGYITGFIQHSEDPELMFARCDVAGVFKSTDAGKTWKVMNNGMSDWHHHCVESICLSPHDPDIVFRCSGDAREYHTFGIIHKSRDGGKTWKVVSEEVDYYGNGPDRMYGETIAVSPHDSQIVVAGGYSAGIYRSDDLGETWNFCGLKGERIGVIAWHPYKENILYAGTISDLGLFGARNAQNINDFLISRHDFARGDTGKLYRSTDNGLTWTLIHKAYGFDIAEIEFYRLNSSKITVLSPYSGLFTSTDSGKSFRNITRALPKVEILGSFDVNPEQDSTLIVALRTPDSIEEKYPIPVFKTTNEGITWEPLIEREELILKDYPSYIRNSQMAGWAISNIEYDIHDTSKVYFSNWYGVSQSVDGGKTWSGYNYTGLETSCLEHIEEDPVYDCHVYYSVADHGPVVSTNAGKSYNHLPKPPVYNASSAFVKSFYDSSLLVYGGVNRSTQQAAIISLQNHSHITVSREFEQGSFVQCVIEDPIIKGRYYALVEGSLHQDAGLYVSIDYSKTWNRLKVDLPDYIQTLPYRKYFIEAELLPIAVYQQRNVCGSDQLLAMDPFIPHRLYLGERSEGLFISNNGGKDWSRIYNELPFGNDTASVLNVLKPDPNIKGVIYAGFIREGLWRSEDFGKTWLKLFPKEMDMIFNVSSFTINELDSEELYVSCEPLYWSKAKSNVLVTHNGGRDWQEIYDQELGALRIKGIEYSEEKHRIYVATSGNGAFYIQKNY